MEWARGALRSLLFAPASHERHARKALASAADGAILDLEDAVAEAERPGARVAASALLRERGEVGPRAYVRINSLRTLFAYEDLCAVVGPGLDGVMVPKVVSASEIATVDWLLAQLEHACGLPEGQIEILPIIETAAGLAAATAVARSSPRVRQLNFGAGDFCLDTDMTWSRTNPGLLWAKAQVVIASREARLEAPIDTVYARLADLGGLEQEAIEAREIGFCGKACIHPSQVTVINRVYTPSAEAVADAKRIVLAFEEGLAHGSASLRVGNQFVDYPVAARARRVLARADTTQRSRGGPSAQ